MFYRTPSLPSEAITAICRRMGFLGTHQVKEQELRDALEPHPEAVHWMGAHLLRAGRVDMMGVLESIPSFDAPRFLAAIDRPRQIPLVGNAITAFGANLPPNAMIWVVERHKPSREMAKFIQETFLSNDSLGGLRKLYQTGALTATDAAQEACRAHREGHERRFEALSSVTNGAALAEAGATSGHMGMVRWALTFLSPVPAAAIDGALKHLSKNGIQETDRAFLSHHLERARLRERMTHVAGGMPSFSAP